MRGSGSRIMVAIGALVSLVVIGTVGYHIVEPWPWFDCFYMTIITLATIGYSEPSGITEHGRYFTVFLIISGVGTVGYALTAIGQSILQGELGSTLEKRRLQNAINQLSNHYIVCGAGRVGTRIARELQLEGASFLVVERDLALSEALVAEGMLVLLGDATDEETLRKAGVDRASGLVCALPSDAENVYIVLTARDLCPDLYIVARVNHDAAAPKVLRAGANKVVSPISTGAHQIAQALLRPTVADFIELVTKTEGLDLVIEELVVAEHSQICGATLRESNIRGALNIIVISIKRASGDMLFNPTGDTILRPGDNIIAVGRRASVDELAQLAAPSESVR